MKRSNAPVYWSLFGAGGMLSALVAPGLVLIVMSGRLGYADVLAIARNPVGKVFLFAVASLFLWHAAHRIYHALHDFGIRTGVLAWILCYGVAVAGTLTAASALLRLGF